MARLRKGEKSTRERRVQRLLRQYAFGLRESEIACELDWQRRTVNNYHCPHTRGGEPSGTANRRTPPGIVPTRVGVNRHQKHSCTVGRNCPHTRGGEPQT
jgi:hypothetical protein